MFQIKPTSMIVATLLVKNEADMIAHTIEHHINHGVTGFIVTDNGSTDGTREIVERYKEVLELIDEPDETHHQSKSVTRMAKLACKFKPEWIIHLDADELWINITKLRNIPADAIVSHRMFLHPPTANSNGFDLKKLRYYLNFESIPHLPTECKVAHRPNPDIEITHGNHGFMMPINAAFTKEIYRHHYPIRSYSQFARKAVDGHLALAKRNAPCPRWEKWYKLYQAGELRKCYDSMTSAWASMIAKPNSEALSQLLSVWSTDEVRAMFERSTHLPEIGEYPRAIPAQMTHSAV